MTMAVGLGVVFFTLFYAMLMLLLFGVSPPPSAPDTIGSNTKPNARDGLNLHHTQ